MQSLLTLLAFLVMLTVIISIHELGHLLAAKAFGVYVSEYSIGMGKLLFSKQGKETKYSLRLLPIGGYCAIAGDNDTQIEGSVDISNLPKERTLLGVAKWKKIIIMLAGVFMNFLLALLIVAGVYLSIGTSVKVPEPIINTVVEGSPADLAGIKAGDEVEKVTLANGYSISPDDWGEFSDFMDLYTDGEITLVIDRDGQELTLEVTPAFNEETDSYYIGVTSPEYTEVKINIINCFGYSYRYLKEMFKVILTSLIGLFRGVGLENLSGPVGIYESTSTAVSMGFSTYLLLVAILSENIGMFNLIPLPVLDGGRVVITIFEWIVGKPISKKLENVIMTASFLLFIVLLVLVTGKDILSLMS